MTIERPKPGAIRISASAVESRLRRVFAPNISGEHKVSSEIVKMWKDKKKAVEALRKCSNPADFVWTGVLKHRCVQVTNLHGL